MMQVSASTHPSAVNGFGAVNSTPFAAVAATEWADAFFMEETDMMSDGTFLEQAKDALVNGWHPERVKAMAAVAAAEAAERQAAALERIAAAFEDKPGGTVSVMGSEINI